MGILSLGTSKGDELTISADGLDEHEAVEAIVNTMGVAIGLDGGGTGTAVIVEDLQTGSLTNYQLGPTNRHSVGDAQVIQTMSDLFKQLDGQKVGMEDIKSICFG
ncbi:hypothetical protein ADUPG1_004650, partial [Aduncisulcus paluster]